MKNIKFLQMSIFCGWSSVFAVHRQTNPAVQYLNNFWQLFASCMRALPAPRWQTYPSLNGATFRYKAFILPSCQHAFILCILAYHASSALETGYVLIMTNVKLDSVMLQIAYLRSTFYTSLQGILYFQDKIIQKERKFLPAWPEHKKIRSCVL